MARAVDFEKVRRRRRFFTTLKRVVALVGVMALIVLAILINDILVEESVTTRLSDITESFGGSGYPVDLPGGIIRGVDNLGNNLTILNDTNFYILSPKGKTVRNIQKMTDSTVAVPAGSRVLTFAPGNKTFRVNSASRELYSETLEFGVLCADMNERGDLAVVAPVKQFASKVYVYDKQFEEIYLWSSPEYITNVSLSPQGDMMAINCVSGDNGVIESLIYLFRFSENKEKATVAMELKDNFCLGIDFAEADRVMVLTDKQYLSLNALGEKRYGYDFGGGKIEGIETRDKQTLLLMREQDGKTQKLVLLDAHLAEKATSKLREEAFDLVLGRDQVYVLTRNGVDIYGYNLELKAQLPKHGISNIHLVGSKLYYLTYDEIRVLSQSELVSVANKQTE